MEKYSIIAGAFIFTIEINHGRPEVFSFILVLPHSELQEYLMRFAFYEERVQQLLQKYLIDPLIEVNTQQLGNYSVLNLCPTSLGHSFIAYLCPVFPFSLSLCLLCSQLKQVQCLIELSLDSKSMY